MDEILYSCNMCVESTEDIFNNRWDHFNEENIFTTKDIRLPNRARCDGCGIRMPAYQMYYCVNK